MPKIKSDKKIKYKLMQIEWVDASRLCGNGWMDLIDVNPDDYPSECISVGYLIAETKKVKILAPTIAGIEREENKHIYGSMSIPKSAIIGERVFK